ncbi:hypothetical protein [Draconibacterium halophilum]|uniref:hypothetical protein n=1 Tax=Draconibacterium halophilum TaxID=2706887 RepID=UPI00193F1BCC|nr:hypothetical protein [Draconibacterium halophilum]
MAETFILTMLLNFITLVKTAKNASSGTNKRRTDYCLYFYGQPKWWPRRTKRKQSKHKIELRFDVANSIIFTEVQKQKIADKLKNRINSEGIIVLFESSERSQLKNKQKAMAKLVGLIEKALTPVKRRIKTKPTKSSKLKRLEKKKQQSNKKQLRQRPGL